MLVENTLKLRLQMVYYKLGIQRNGLLTLNKTTEIMSICSL